ncbi:cytochrome c oxidase subunit 3 [Bowmanella dokdonensis]|uniref:Cytochrome c oxidase subunit 3 n=1 Tax=Bowmanella dokdonensis TaxID=751969 RepID=A0A939IS04_9ALTE|nr:cytochrome c oxidase subunit 3 [Bowmanella dokdonensis]MBN7826202.1 cytochrome c oxidase subunit 3 [Bowmanella dokdonensis]
MSLLQVLREKPWQAQAVSASTSGGNVGRTGLKILLGVISVLFLLFFVAFLMRSQYPDWQPLAEEPGQPLYNKSALWLNTIYLGVASLMFQWASRSAGRSNWRTARVGMLLGGLFAAAFVGGQWMFWQELQSQGFLVNDSPALSFFYLLTGLHAVHVLAGLLVWLLSMLGLAGRLHRTDFVRLCTLYWHFLLLLWLVLFGFLVSKPETYDAIAAFCGLG